MTLQSLCHGSDRRVGPAVVVPFIALMGLCAPTLSLGADPIKNDYPTQARVEYVNECISKSGGKLASLYQCSCAIDRIAQTLAYDDFVEASTFAKYASLPGEAGGEFRDSEKAKKLAKLFRDLEAEAWSGCGLGS